MIHETLLTKHRQASFGNYAVCKHDSVKKPFALIHMCRGGWGKQQYVHIKNLDTKRNMLHIIAMHKDQSRDGYSFIADVSFSVGPT
jgi:hypothetical protein